MITFFPLAVSITTGLKETPSELLKLSESLGANTWRRFTHIRIHHAVPHIFVGAKISITLCIIGSVVAEIMAADEGLGYLIQFSTSLFKVPQAWASLTVLVAATLPLFQLVCWAQKLFFRGASSGRGFTALGLLYQFGQPRTVAPTDCYLWQRPVDIIASISGCRGPQPLGFNM